MWESHFERKKWKITNYFYIDLKFGTNSLFCCNGYSHAIFTIIFHESQVEYLRKAFTKELKKKNSAYLLLFYDLNYLILTKSWLSNQKSGMVLELTLFPNL
jgi:hypothetical protein